MATTPLGVLDLVPISSGSTAAQALRNSIDLARHAERLGYARYWFAEHHLNPGVAGTSPAVVLALTAAATSTIRIGSGAVQVGHRTALATVEEFGLIDALHPGRLDLGLGRSGGKPKGTGPDQPVPDATPVVNGRAPNGLLIPPRFSMAELVRTPRFRLQRAMLQLPGATPVGYTEQVGDILALLRGCYRSPDGLEARAVPGEHADVQVWIIGSSGGESAQVAGDNGLRFAANYHVARRPCWRPRTATGPRSARRPSWPGPTCACPPTWWWRRSEAEARELAAGFGPWVASIRSARGAIEYPTPAEARAMPWTEADQALVADRLDTQFVGDPGQVCAQLEQLREATGADELLVTTITHQHADRVRSYQLLAQEWARR